MMRSIVCAFVLAAGLLAGCQSSPPPFKAMSMEVLGEVRKGAFGLAGRFPAVLKAIEQESPDVLAVQGITPEQFAALGKRLPEGYATATWPARKEDEKLWAAPVVGLAYKTERFEEVARGGFWHSATQNEPLSKSWDAQNATCSYWLRLRSKHAARYEFAVLASRLDHRGPRARANAAKLIRRHVEAWAGAPVVLLLNAHSGPQGAAYEELTADRGNYAHLFDAFAALQRTGAAIGTRHNFQGGEDVPRVDFILHSRQFLATDGAVVRLRHEGEYPGPHYPITTVLAWNEGR